MSVTIKKDDPLHGPLSKPNNTTFNPFLKIKSKLILIHENVLSSLGNCMVFRESIESSYTSSHAVLFEEDRFLNTHVDNFSPFIMTILHSSRSMWILHKKNLYEKQGTKVCGKKKRHQQMGVHKLLYVWERCVLNFDSTHADGVFIYRCTIVHRDLRDVLAFKFTVVISSSITNLIFLMKKERSYPITVYT